MCSYFFLWPLLIFVGKGVGVPDYAKLQVRFCVVQWFPVRHCMAKYIKFNFIFYICYFYERFRKFAKHISMQAPSCGG